MQIEAQPVPGLQAPWGRAVGARGWEGGRAAGAGKQEQLGSSGGAHLGLFPSAVARGPARSHIVDGQRDLTN